MGWLMPTSEWTLDNIFDRRWLDNKGSASDKYMLSHMLVARWDFYIYTAICASQPLITGSEISLTAKLASIKSSTARKAGWNGEAS